MNLNGRDVTVDTVVSVKREALDSISSKRGCPIR